MFVPVFLDTIALSLIAGVAMLVTKQNRRPSFLLLFLGVYAVARIVALVIPYPRN